jgi:hypothetical protein
LAKPTIDPIAEYEYAQLRKKYRSNNAAGAELL